jgi:hypothetical protein
MASQQSFLIAAITTLGCGGWLCWKTEKRFGVKLDADQRKQLVKFNRGIIAWHKRAVK